MDKNDKSMIEKNKHLFKQTVFGDTVRRRLIFELKCDFLSVTSLFVSSGKKGTVDERIKSANDAVDSFMRDAKLLDTKIKKLLLLGTGNSGKSTLFKSLKIITKDQNLETETRDAQLIIRQNCISGILTLLKKSQELFDEDPKQNSDCLVEMNKEIVSAIQLIVSYKSETFEDVSDCKEVERLGICLCLLSHIYIHVAHSCDFLN